MKVTRRRLAVPVAVVLAVAAGGLGLAAAQATAAPACRVGYRVTGQWDTGFAADVTVTNLGPALSSWSLGWSLAPGQGVVRGQGATVTATGSAVTATGPEHDRAVAAGATIGFSFTGTRGGGNPVPAAFALNGTACAGPVTTPAPTPCTGPGVPSQPPAPAKVRVWLAGDSTMMEPQGTCPVGWGSELGPYLNGDVAVRNSAAGGRSIQSWLFGANVTGARTATGDCLVSPAAYHPRWTAMLDTATGMRAGDYLIVQFGINDGAPSCPRHVGPDRYRELLTVMVRDARARGALPIVVTPVAALTCDGGTAVGSRGFLTETRAVATAEGVPLIDLHQRSVGLYNALGLCLHDGGYGAGAAGAFFCRDATHFEAGGARRIAGLVAAALREQGIPLAAYLR